tara:strand:+ start:324 stop:767 length:444 start_codon:yes stop_codon:yes gene_type:complete
MSAAVVSIFSCGAFFLFGLITGVIKYQQIVASPRGRAHIYIDTCHRASLMYAFACLIVYEFVLISELADWLELMAVILLVGYFATAVISYFIHGIRQDTRNQLHLNEGESPTLIHKAIPWYMWSLIAAEIGGFLILFYGVIIALMPT